MSEQNGQVIEVAVNHVFSDYEAAKAEALKRKHTKVYRLSDGEGSPIVDETGKQIYAIATSGEMACGRFCTWSGSVKSELTERRKVDGAELAKSRKRNAVTEILSMTDEQRNALLTELGIDPASLKPVSAPVPVPSVPSVPSTPPKGRKGSKVGSA